MPEEMRSSITGHDRRRVVMRGGRTRGIIVAVTGTLVAAFAVAALAGVARPPVTGQLPTMKDAGLRYAGPTENITKVANALTVRAKSLTTQVKVLPGLVLTKPVTITVNYSSPAGQNRIAQIYDTKFGNRILYNDPVGNRYPRQMTMSIVLTEDNPGGQPFTYSFPQGKLTLDPLFDVSITPLRFTMTSKCDRFGKSEIVFSWTSPQGGFREKKFSTTKGKTVTISEFAWTKQEVSASANLFWPQWAFYESDPAISGAYLGGFPPPTIKLLPGWSGYVGRSLTAGRGQSGCTADIAFDITIQVRQYPNL